MALSIDKTARALAVRARGPIACHVYGWVVVDDDGRALGARLHNGGGNPATVTAKAADGTALALWTLGPYEWLAIPFSEHGFLEAAALWEASAYMPAKPPRQGLCRFEHVREGDDDPWGDW